jgi:ferric-dicitrate binding protein FerR (iron transport regulator)
VTAHEPKIAALIAFDAQALSVTGRARVEKHLGTCQVCREALASMRAYDALAKDVRAEPVPELDWAKMELALEREARAQAQANAEAVRAQTRGAMGPWVGAVALAAAALLAFWVTREPERTELTLPEIVQQPEQVLAARAAERAAEPATGEVTAVAVAAVGIREGAQVALEPGTPVTEGMELHTEVAGRIDARLGAETGIVVAESSRVSVARLRNEQVELVLAGGTVASQVQSRGEHGTYAIEAGPYRMVVRGTRFAVTREGAEVAVTVDEGIVDVVRGQRVVAVVWAPGTWRSNDGVTDVPVGAVPTPRGLDPVSSTWPVIRIPRVRGVAMWRLAGSTLPGASELAMRVPEGDLELYAIGPTGLEVRHLLQIGPEGAMIDANAMAMAPTVRPQAPIEREGFLHEDQIRDVIRARHRHLQAIQNRIEGRRGPEDLTVSGRMRVRVTIGRTGEVMRADVVDARGLLPEVFQEEVRAEILGWTFPAPSGGVVTVELPLTFTHRQ